MKPFFKITLFTALVVVVAGVAAGIYLFNKKHDDLSKVKPQYTMTSEVLYSAFDSNENEASAKYINKIIEVSGIISSVKKEDNGNVNISLKTGSDMSSVICTFTALNDPDNIHPGDSIRLRGVCSGYLMDVLLNDCAIVR